MLTVMPIDLGLLSFGARGFNSSSLNALPGQGAVRLPRNGAME